MKGFAITMTVIGFVVTVVGAVRIYLGRMREDPEHPGLYIPAASGPGDLVLTIIGAVVGVTGSVIGSLAD